MSRGTRAVLPDGAYERPPAVSEDWVVRAVGDEGQDNGTYDFTCQPGASGLWGPLAEAFGARAGSGGSWPRKITVQGGWNAVGRFLRWMAEEYPEVSDLRAMTSAMWSQFLLSLPPSVRSARGRMVQGLLLDTPVLTARAREAVERSITEYEPKVQRSLSETEMQTIERRALKTLVLAERRIRRGWALVEGYRRGRLTQGSAAERWGWLLNHIVENYDVPRYERSSTPTAEVVRVLAGSSPMSAFARLYLTAPEASAWAIGFSVKEGLNKSVVLDLECADISRPDAQDGSERRIFRVATDKARRGDQRYNSLNLVDTGRHSSAYLLGLLFDATDAGRRQLAALDLPHDDLVLCLPLATHGRKTRDLPPLTSSRVDDGVIVEKGLRRWRTSLPAGLHGVTFQVAHRSFATQRGLQGHTEATNEEVYQLNDSRVQEAQAPVIATGLQDAYEKAMEPRVLSTDASAAPDIPGDLAAAIDAGELDTATASCADHEHSPFDDGRSCTASFLSCLGCRNAFVVPRHLPRLIYLHWRLEGLRGNVSENLWRRQYAVHWERLADLLDTKFTTAERAAAEREITDLDRAMIDSLLLRRYDV